MYDCPIKEIASRDQIRFLSWNSLKWFRSCESVIGIALVNPMMAKQIARMVFILILWSKERDCTAWRCLSDSQKTTRSRVNTDDSRKTTQSKCNRLMFDGRLDHTHSQQVRVSTPTRLLIFSLTWRIGPAWHLEKLPSHHANLVGGNAFMFFPHTQVPGHVLCLLRYLYVLGFIRYVTQGKIPNPESRCTARPPERVKIFLQKVSYV